MDNGDKKQSDTETSKERRRRTWSLPSWLDGRTIAILTGMASLAAMMQTTHSGLRDDIHRLRDEMYAIRTELRQEIRLEVGGLRQEMHQEIGGLHQEIGGLRQQIRALRKEMYQEIGALRREMHQEIDALRRDMNSLRHELRAGITKLDERLRIVEIDVAAIRTHLGLSVRPPRDEPQHEPS